MGKLKPRLASRKKAKRWKKGQSSSSNPETRKHREQARSRFFQENLGSGALSSDLLKKHDAIQGVKPAIEKIQVDGDETESTVASTFKTFDTFASDWSNCSNVSFNRFLAHFESKSLIQKEMLAVLAAITDVIKENGGTESSTEYYAALMSTLESSESEESVIAILSLLGMGIKTVPKNVLKLQFDQSSQTLFQVLTKYTASENFLLLKHCIGCLSLLLRVQDAAVWSDVSTMHILHGILSFTIHSKPKVRKAAQHAICALLKGSDIMKSDNPPLYHPAAPEVAKHCLKQLEVVGQAGGMTTILHVLTLLKDIFYQLPKSFIKTTCESLLKLMTMNNALVTSCCLQVLHGLFVSRPAKETLLPELNGQIINALYDYQPALGDAQPTLAWLAVMQEAHCNLAIHSLHLCAANVPRMIEKCTELWLVDKREILTGVSHTIKTLLEVCVAPLCETQQLANKYKVTLSKTIQLIQEGMKYQYNSAWHYVLHLIAVLFQIAGKVCKDELLNILVGLADLRDSHRFTYNSEIEYAVGAAVMTMGPQVVLETIPLQTNPDSINLNRSWLLPVLKDCIKQASLSYFINTLLPLAVMCEKKSTGLMETNDGVGSHTYALLMSQIWALLPCFCNDADDIKDSFKNIARILGSAISEKKDLRLSVMASLRKLITRSKEKNNTEDIAELSRFAKNYLPLLFNLYTMKPNGSDEEGQRLAAFDTIKVYLSITNKALVGELFDNALIKLKDPETETFVKESVFDLVRLLIQFTDDSKLKVLYDFCTPTLMNMRKGKEQKKSYRFLEEMCGADVETCKNFVNENCQAIQKVLRKSAPYVATISKGARLRCLNHLISSHPDLKKTKLFKEILPEVVLCTKVLNERCRTSAFQLLNTMAEILLDDEELFKEYIDMLAAGLGGSPSYCSATLLALASITYKYNGALGVQTIQEIVEKVSGLLTVPTREIVLSALSYIKVYLTVIPLTIVAPSLPSIMKALSGMTDDCKRHFRQKVRDLLIKLVRKFGIEAVTNLIPSNDAVMHKRIKNIRKVQSRKQKAKEQRKLNEAGSDSEEEFNAKRRPKSMEEILADSDEDFENVDESEQTNHKKRTNRKKTWIREGEDDIVDFADPTAIKNITTSLPEVSNTTVKQKTKTSEFKVAKDGRLIIKDDSDDDSDTPKRMRKMTIDNDSDEDSEGAESVAPGMPSKRKRKLSGSTEASSQSNMRYQAGGSGIHRPVKKSKDEKVPGSEYRSKKAKGDIKKKGKPDPYAYLPLTRSVLNRRKKMKNAGRFKNIISKAKSGVRIAMKNKGKRRQK
ncbi:RRP12-like protein isoform X2 [Orussus abietinus]|uniref:RRP12-like protein isoform X2 n=1 Tax=Orussus abietinus TaxID=222816 RepID=UPI000625134D|nr:RRP12-like protein isoform X2 [Orussus abietinus]